LGIYHLNLLISFLSPKIDPAFAHFEGIIYNFPLLIGERQLINIIITATKFTDSANDGPELPTTVDEEFRPFIRKLPEFKFWYSVWKSTIIALFCTLFGVFDVPVFWPILVAYFIGLFCLTMKRQIKVLFIYSYFLSPYLYSLNTNFSLQHMIKYRYLPFTHGKPKYAEADYGNWLRATPKK